MELKFKNIMKVKSGPERGILHDYNYERQTFSIYGSERITRITNDSLRATSITLPFDPPSSRVKSYALTFSLLLESVSDVTNVNIYSTEKEIYIYIGFTPDNVYMQSALPSLSSFCGVDIVYCGRRRHVNIMVSVAGLRALLLPHLPLFFQYRDLTTTHVVTNLFVL